MNGHANRTPLNVALIGCGRISQVHFQTIANEPGAKLIAVADVDEKAAKSAAEAYGAKAFSNPYDMLEATAPQAVIICTPPDSHRSIVEAAFAAGAHVLCEKPLAISLDDAKAMVLAADRGGRVLMMASKFRYVADVIKAKGLIESEILGEVVLLENEFCARVDMKKRWNSNKEVAGGGVLIDNGSHSVDIFRYLVGPVMTLQAIFGKQWQDINVEDTCHLHLRNAGGVVGSVDLSWSIHKESPFFISLYGTEGMLEIGWKGSRYRQSEKLDWVSFGSGYDKFAAVGGQLTNFIDTIIGRAEPLISPEDAIESVRVIQKAYESAVDSRWQKV